MDVFTQQQLAEDFRIFRGALEVGHPGIYRYVPKETIDRQFGEAEKKLNHPMDVYDFYRIVAPMAARIECGHTSANLPGSSRDVINRSVPLLPFQVKLIGKKVYIFRDLSNEDGRLAGSEIRSINGARIEKIVKNLAASIPGDGEIPTSRLRQVGQRFSLGLSVLLGMHAPYTVTYRAKQRGKEMRMELPGLTLEKLTEISKAKYPQDDVRPDHSADLKFMDEDRIAVLSIYGFGGFADKEKKRPLADFIKESFALFQQRGTKALILDVRNNGGGEDELGKLLFSFLTDRPFQYYDDLVINALHFGFLRYTDHSEGIPENDVQKMPDGHYRLVSHPNWGEQQPSKPTFAGKVFVLLNGGSFSTTCEFVSTVHFHHRAVFIGEEAGGGYYGNTSGFMPVLTLPNTKVTVRVPLMKYVMAVSGYRFPKRGVMPDVPIQPSINDRLTGRDPEIEAALTLARKSIAIRSASVAPSKNAAKIETAFQEKLPLWMAESHVPAVGIAVIEDGKLKEAKAFGELRKGVPAPINTLFEVASLTKPIVTMLTLRLAASGQWDLDEPLDNYWVDPDLKDDPRHKALTTRIVLSHQTGFPNWRTDSPSKKLAFDFDPGTRYRYSGEGFEYLRQALEHKFGKPLEQLASSVLLEPVGMKETRFFWDETTEESRFATPHDKDGNPSEEQQAFYKKTRGANAADRVMTTISDYGKFAPAVIKRSGLAKKVFEEMIKPQVGIPEADGIALSFGLGWLLVPNMSGGEFALVHDGHDFGVRTLIVLLPKTRRGLVILTNGEKGDEIFNKVILESLDVGKELITRLK